MNQNPVTQGGKRFRATVANHGFRGAYWQKGDIVEVTPEESEIIPKHFEALETPTDGSEDKGLQEKLVEQEKIDAMKDAKAKETYDQVRPEIAGGPAVAVEDKTPEQKKQEAADRKAEEIENDKELERQKKNPRKRNAIAPEDAAVIARVAKENRDSEDEAANERERSKKSK